MRPASERSARRSGTREIAERLLLTLAIGFAGCAPRDGQVGLVPAPSDAGGSAGAVLFSSELGSNGGLWQVYTPLRGASVTFGVSDTRAGDGRVAELRFPGNPSLMPADDSDADLNTGIATNQFFRYGTFRGRVRFATCAPGEDVASAVFMYFADGSDANGNGLEDVHELDFHVLCGTPTFIVLSAWSDYQLRNGVETFLKLSHAVDTATGDVYDTPMPGDPAFAKTGNVPQLAHPGFPAAGQFYDVGIEWHPTQARFFIVLDGVELTLWDLNDVRYVPQVPLPMMFNLWHPPTHWVPARTPADYPANDALMLVDRAEWRAP